MISEKVSFSLDSSVSALLQIREALAMSRNEFGNQLGVDYDTINKWERSKVNIRLSIPQIKRLDKFIKQLGLTWEDLPDHLGDPNISPPEVKRIKTKLG